LGINQGYGHSGAESGIAGRGTAGDYNDNEPLTAATSVFALSKNAAEQSGYVRVLRRVSVTSN
jgi:hypothetical protein